ncbi:MAG: serine hydrolase [bacterium]
MRPRHLFPTLIAALLFILQGSSPLHQDHRYFPDPGPSWEHRAPSEVGMDAGRVEEAVAFAQEIETSGSADLEAAHLTGFGREPLGDAVGPFRTRGPASGVIVRKGYIVAEWGDPHRVDMTFSVTKSFLSSTVGAAFDRGLIRSVQDTVADYMAPIHALDPASVMARDDRGRFPRRSQPFIPFASEHNRRITWEHLLRQTSDWSGTLWGKPDWADRPARDPGQWLDRELREPGTAYEYNDTRVNLLALAATNVWRRPLPGVLREYVMDPIGASPTWRWHGYENSWVLLDGLEVQVPSGGGHWGGGMFISARDMARFGYLTLNEGRWGDQQVLSQEWIGMARSPEPANPGYGFMNFFLNTGQRRLPSAPEEAFVHLGAGTNMVYADPVNDLVIVARWIDQRRMDELVEAVIASIDER